MIQAVAPGSGCQTNNGQPQAKLVGHDSCVQKLRSEIAAVARHECTVLICGESGTGKELVARSIHASSSRATGPFIIADCTALPDALFESQLFGHVKGAFTDAKHSTLGLFRAADGGTLLIDEIGELPLHTQATLLRCIQEHSVLPVGAVHPVHVDVRVMVATHRDLKDMIARGQFREDLYYRLDVVRLQVPPLRRHRGDIAPLTDYFLEQYATVHGGPVKSFSDEALLVLENYSWPGNIRELRNVTERAVVLSKNHVLTISDLPELVRNARQQGDLTGACLLGKGSCLLNKLAPLHVVERWVIEHALRATDGNQSRAAELLEVERHRFARMIARHGLRPFMNSLRLSAHNARH